MAHFAKIVNGKVVNVVVAEKDYFNNFTDTTPGEWIQTSYNTVSGVHTNGGTPLRKNFACKDMIYDRERDAFYFPSPYPSWTLNETTCQWEAPITAPSEPSWWDEENNQWVLM